MARALRESTVEQRIITYAKKLKVLPLKFNSPGTKGYPDRMFLHRGSVLFMEVKRPGEVPTPLQLYRLKELQDQGFRAVWVDNADAGMCYIDELVSL